MKERATLTDERSESVWTAGRCVRPDSATLAQLRL